jgi:hypothetical protein
MRNLISNHQEEVINDNNQRELDIVLGDLTQEKNNQIIKYNETIQNLDPVYANLNPLNHIIVRVVLKEMQRTESGLLKPNTIFVKKPTESGFGYIAEMESPFPYTLKAIIVAVPDQFKDKFKSGQFVYLNEEQVEAVALGKGNNAAIRIKNVFTHPEFFVESGTPSEPANQHYGYLKVNPYNIDFIVND